MIAQMTGNWVCWAILMIALFCYQQLWDDLLHGDGKAEHASIAPTLTAAMPLLGLLGTIIGLLDVFADMARSGSAAATLSGGIADALLTTELGLVCAVPSWLFQGYIRSRRARLMLVAQG